LVVLAIALLLFVLYTFRIRQLKKVIAVRQKISQNLHDEIGSTLSAINMYTQVAKLQPQQSDFLNSIEENTQDVLSKLDDIIWSTNPKNDKCSNLVNRMEVVAFPLCKANGVQFNIVKENIADDQNIPEAVRQNLFSIFKESLNNALKYAKCTQITAVLSIKNSNIVFSLTDNGKGFDTGLPTERNGLLNMQLRTKELKGKCSITSTLGKGTIVSVQIPL
jgi:signal transduction histidine kinase